VRDRLTDESGASLLEVLVAVVILAIAATALVGGLLTSITVSDVHRKQTTAGAVAQDYAEKITGILYVECATPAAYALAPAAVPVPAGYTAAVDSVEYWNGSAFGGTCTSGGVQRVTVRVGSDDGRATEKAVVVVRQP
jgi:Tfp pilus assembly protein PilV